MLSVVVFKGWFYGIKWLIFDQQPDFDQFGGFLQECLYLQQIQFLFSHL